MQIQKIQDNNIRFTAAHAESRFWGKEGKRVKNALKQINQMRVVKNADCNIEITKYHPQILTVYAQPRSGLFRNPKEAHNVYVNTVAHEQSLTSAVKRVIIAFNRTHGKQKSTAPKAVTVKPKQHQTVPENKKPTFFQKIINFGKKIFNKF